MPLFPGSINITDQKKLNGCLAQEEWRLCFGKEGATTRCRTDSPPVYRQLYGGGKAV